MRGNQYKATFILGMVSVGFFISYPFQHNFMGGLLANGFKAAMIGGLADWFAVSALFRRPLGIPFRTAIIPRNREKIFKALIEMVENQILMKENIKRRLDDYQISSLLVHFMVERRGKSYLKKILYRFLQDMLSQIKPEEVVAIIDHIVQHDSKKVRYSMYIADVAQWLITHRYHEKIIDVIIEQLIIVARHQQLQPVLVDIFIHVRESYERGMNRRKFFNRLMNVSPTQVASSVQQILVTILSDMKNTDHPVRQQISIWLSQFIVKLKTDQKFQQNLEDWVQEKIICKLTIGNYIAQRILILSGEENAINKQLIRWLTPITNQIDNLVGEFATNQEQRAKFDDYFKTILSGWIDAHHHKIGMIVKDSLHSLTNELLVNFIETKVGNDLQMIRINGSVVGGLVGMVIYLLTFWL